MSLTTEDEDLILDLFDERMRLKAQLKNLTNEAIADKFEVSKAEIAALQKRGVPHATIQPRNSCSHVPIGTR